MAPPGETETAAAPTPVATATAPNRLAGKWHATFDVAKGKVRLPSGVATRTWERDDGKTAHGEVQVRLVIAKSGQLQGRASGALGALGISGQVFGDKLRAKLTASQGATDPLGMRGILLGEAHGENIIVRLRVASHDASLVRAGRGQLERLAAP
jgi:hypothetical protein